MTFILRGTDGQDDNQKYGAWVDAEMKSLEAVAKFPALGETPHMQAGDDIKEIAVQWLNFKEVTSANSSNFYRNYRSKFPTIGPGTALVFRLSGQRSFTKNNADDLETYLKSHQLTSHLNVEVGYNPASPRCVIRVGL